MAHFKAVCQDPRFIGGDGITFYFHGRRDRDFCLATDPVLHINAHFIGKRVPGKTRDVTWVQSVASSSPAAASLSAPVRPPSGTYDTANRLDFPFDDEPVEFPWTQGAKW